MCCSFNTFHICIWSQTSVTFREFSRLFYPKRPTTIHTPIHTSTAESHTQGDSQLVGSS